MDPPWGRGSNRLSQTLIGIILVRGGRLLGVHVCVRGAPVIGLESMVARLDKVDAHDLQLSPSSFFHRVSEFILVHHRCDTGESHGACIQHVAEASPGSSSRCALILDRESFASSRAAQGRPFLYQLLNSATVHPFLLHFLRHPFEASVTPPENQLLPNQELGLSCGAEQCKQLLPRPSFSLLRFLWTLQIEQK